MAGLQYWRIQIQLSKAFVRFAAFLGIFVNNWVFIVRKNTPRNFLCGESFLTGNWAVDLVPSDDEVSRPSPAAVVVPWLSPLTCKQ